MRIGQYRRLTLEDHPDVPEEFMQTLNTVLEDMTNALMTGLTFSDNFRAEVRTLQIKHDTTVPIRLQRLTRNPSGVLLLKSTNYDYARLAWQPSSKDLTVDVKIKWDNAPAVDPTVTLLFIGG